MSHHICCNDYCQEANLTSNSKAPAIEPGLRVAKYGGVWRRYQFAGYSTVTDLAKFRGWSTLQPRLTAT